MIGICILQYIDMGSYDIYLYAVRFEKKYIIIHFITYTMLYFHSSVYIIAFNSLAPGIYGTNLTNVSSNSFYRSVPWAIPVKLVLDDLW